MRPWIYFLSLCAAGTLLVGLALLPLGFFFSSEGANPGSDSDITGALRSAGMLAGYAAYVLVVFFLLALVMTKVPVCRRALRWYAFERRRARLRKSGAASEVPATGRKRGIRTRPGLVTTRKIVTKVKVPPGW